VYGLLGFLQEDIGEMDLGEREEDVLFFVWEPLAGQTWPVKGMGYDKVVEVRCILFPMQECLGLCLDEGRLVFTKFYIPEFWSIA
jgi:hypothetical protein